MQMSLKTLCGHFTLGLSLLLGAACVQAAEYPRPQDGIWIVKDFRFHTGEVLPELKLHYVTVGEPTGEPVLGRNWMLRRMMMESIRADPGWNNGNYSEQPPSLKVASIYFSLATSGGTQRWHHDAPTRAQADQVVDARLAQRFGADANNLI